MGIDDQPREGGVTRRVLAWRPKSSGEAEGRAREGASAFRHPPLAFVLRPCHGAHRKAIWGSSRSLRSGSGSHPILAAAAWSSGPCLRRALSRRCGPTADPRPHTPGALAHSVQKRHRTSASRHAAFRGPEEGAGVRRLCSGCCQELR